MLSELETRNQKTARSDFMAAVWQGQEAAKLLPLAKAAGLSGSEADSLIRQIDEAKQLIEHANLLPALRKGAATANARFDKTQSRAAKKIERLEAKVQAAWIDADDAKMAVRAAESSSRQLLFMYDTGLLPLDSLPADTHHLITHRKAESQFLQIDHTRVVALEARNHHRAVLGNLEDKLAKLPLSVTIERDESLLQKRIKEAKQNLKEAEVALAKAEAASEAARRAIPASL